MAIERGIYGSLPKGIDSDKAGYQYYSYTPGFKALFANSQDKKSKFEGSYNPPKTYREYNKYVEIPVETRNPNTFADAVAQEHPNAFTYYFDEFDGVKKACFIYGKNLGMDWTGNRPNPVFLVSTICDLDDVRKYPIKYCTSPSVCCDVKRTEFYREDGSAPTPAMLTNLPNLDSDDAALNIAHKAAFSSVTLSVVQQFLSKGNNIDVFCQMLYSLMKKKDGNEKSTILLADKKENMVLWIAALSYAFPIENTIDFTFTTYAYDRYTCDFNGIFRRKSNNVLDETEEPTPYNFSDLVNKYAVYDFDEDYFDTDDDVSDMGFFTLIQSAYTLGAYQKLEEFMGFIQDETSYKGMGTEYIDGYNLYRIVQNKMNLLSFEEVKKATAFAKKYADKTNQKLLLEQLLGGYAAFIDEAEIGQFLADYINFCDANGVERKENSTSSFFDSMIKSVETLNDPAAFTKQGNFTINICSYAPGELEIAIVKELGFDKINELSGNIPEWKAAYLRTAVCKYVAKETKDLSDTSREAQNIYNLSLRLNQEDPALIIKDLKYARGIFGDDGLTLLYARICDTAYEKNMGRKCREIGEFIVNLYVNGNAANRNLILDTIGNNKLEDRYLGGILEGLYANSECDQFIDNVISLVSNKSVDVTCITEDAQDMLHENMGRSTDVNRAPFVVWRTMFVIKKIKLALDEPMTKADVHLFAGELIDAFDKKYPKMYISKDDMDLALKMCQSLSEVGMSDSEENKTFLAYGAACKLNDMVGKTGRSKVFYDKEVKSPELYVNISEIPEEVADKYLFTLGEICGRQWIEEGNSWPKPTNFYFAPGKSREQMEYSYEARCKYFKSLFAYVMNNDSSKSRKIKIAKIINSAYSVDKKFVENLGGDLEDANPSEFKLVNELIRKADYEIKLKELLNYISDPDLNEYVKDIIDAQDGGGSNPLASIKSIFGFKGRK